MFPFSSQSKKMSVLVKHQETGKIIYFCKGAEVVMEGMIKKNQRLKVLEYTESLAVDGFRALVFAMKVLGQNELEDFMYRYK